MVRLSGSEDALDGEELQEMEDLGIRVSGEGTDFNRFAGLKNSARVLEEAIFASESGLEGNFGTGGVLFIESIGTPTSPNGCGGKMSNEKNNPVGPFFQELLLAHIFYLFPHKVFIFLYYILIHL